MAGLWRVSGGFMAGSKKLTSLTETKVKAFHKEAAYKQSLSCERISGFHLYKNKASTSYKYRSTARGKKRIEIVIGNIESIGINDAAKIAQRMLDAINNGDNPKDVLKDSSKSSTTRAIKKDSNDNIYLGNFFRNVFQPERMKSGDEDGLSGKQTCQIIEREFDHLFDKKMSSLSSEEIHQWQDSKEKKRELKNGSIREYGYAYSTINRNYNALLGLLSMAVKLSHIPNGKYQGLLPEPPFKVKALRGASAKQKAAYVDTQKQMDQSKRRVLEDKELKAIESAMLKVNIEMKEARTRSLKKKNRQHLPDLAQLEFAHFIIPFIYIAYYTGLRPGDICTLKWSEVSHGQLSKMTSKSSHLDEPVIVKFKIGDTKKLLKYSLKEVLDIWKEQQAHLKSKYLFPFTDKKTGIIDINRPMGRDAYSKQFDKIKEKSKVFIDMYGFRHHFISKLLKEGTHISLVANLAGHKSIKMIEQHYSHHLPDDKSQHLSVL